MAEFLAEGRSSETYEVRSSRGRGVTIAAWIVYGMGSSAYLLMIPTIGYATYFHTQVAQDGPQAASLWAIAVAIALVIAGIIAPFLGAHADRTGKRPQILFALTASACIFTAALSLVVRGDIFLGIVLFIGAHVAF